MLKTATLWCVALLLGAPLCHGYLWWLKSFGPPERPYAAYLMSGNGGNKVAAVPELDLAVVITSTNYNGRGMHQQTDRILSDCILAGVQKQ
jgi:hypothetical protein